MSDIIITLGSVAGAIVTIISLFAIFKSPLKKWAENRKAKKAKSQEIENSIIEMKQMLSDHIKQDQDKQALMTLHSEALLCLLRNEQTKIYYKYLSKKQLPSYEKENLTKQHLAYHNLNGNTYIDSIYDEMMSWVTIT